MQPQVPVLNRVATVIIVLLVVVVGGVITLTDAGRLSFSDYLRDVSIALGLLGIGYGIDAHSKP